MSAVASRAKRSGEGADSSSHGDTMSRSSYEGLVVGSARGSGCCSGGSLRLQSIELSVSSQPAAGMPDDVDDRHFLWLWTWIVVAVSSAGYAVVNLLSAPPGAAEGAGGVFRFLVEVALPIGMCALAAWLGIEEWRRSKNAA